MPKSVVEKNTQVSGDFRLIRLRMEGAKKLNIKPGQFVMLRVSEGLDPLLRRPFSVYDSEGGSVVELLYKVVGKGTAIMRDMVKGDGVDVMGPLGKPFPAVKDPSKLVMVAGGIGAAPFYLLTKEIAKKRGTPLFLFGARTKADAKIASLFKGLNAKTFISTEDGSVGAKGRVTALLEKKLSEGSVIYACGPMGMLKAVSAVAKERGVKCLVSLEAGMCCGIGVCLGCAVKTIKHEKSPDNALYKMVCSDGPVFDANDIDWGSFR
ncbi:MAG: dihydroorotate dehydrogenase electron transfer subunit [Deltaproteobacteria bacterium]|nr:dihydroorotate dehydrogenase electron transfer subunit [Deltaproteobacteria bacterium]